MKRIYLLLAAALMFAACGTKEKQTNMKFRPLGNTGLMVSEISIGCGGFEKIDSAASLELMTMALDSGMNYIDLYDASPVTRSNIGYALKGRRDEMIIQGHIGNTFKNGQHSRTRDLEETKSSFEDMLTRLGTDHIEVGMIHIADSPEEWEEIQNSPFLDYVFQLKKEGKIQHIGLSSHNAYIVNTKENTYIAQLEDGKLLNRFDFGHRYHFFQWIDCFRGDNPAPNQCFEQFKENKNSYGVLEIQDTLIHICHIIHNQDSLSYIGTDNIKPLLQFLLNNLDHLTLSQIDSVEKALQATCQGEFRELANDYFPKSTQTNKFGKMSYYTVVDSKKTLSVDYCVHKSDSIVCGVFFEWLKTNRAA